MFVVKISIKNSMEMIKDVKWHFILYKKDKTCLCLVRKRAWLFWGKEISRIAQMSKHENIRNFPKMFSLLAKERKLN